MSDPPARLRQGEEMPPKPGKNPRESMRKGPTEHRVIVGDSRRMPELPDESVQLVVCSPPYANLKIYELGNPRQLGHISDYDQFLDELDKVWAHCFRVLMGPSDLARQIVGVSGRKEQPGRTVIDDFHQSANPRGDDWETLRERLDDDDRAGFRPDGTGSVEP